MYSITSESARHPDILSLIAALDAPAALPQLPQTIAPGTPAELFDSPKEERTQRFLSNVL